MARTANGARIPVLGKYGMSSAPTFGTDLTDLSDDIEQIVDATVSLPGDLPLTGNWPGRQMRVLQDNCLYYWNAAGGAWVRSPLVTGNVFSGTTSSLGVVTINHGLGNAVPKSVVASIADDTPTLPQGLLRVQPIPSSFGGTSFQLRFIRGDTNAFVNALAVKAYWMAYA